MDKLIKAEFEKLYGTADYDPERLEQWYEQVIKDNKHKQSKEKKDD